MPITNRRIAPESDEFYPTDDPYATQVFIEREKFTGSVWECACGDGQMAFVLEDAGLDVLSSDVNDHGYGSCIDFLNSKFRADNIVTNPPYALAEDFVEQALKLASKKVAMLLRLGFLEGGDRYEWLYSKTPPSRIYIFSSRLTFYKRKAIRNHSIKPELRKGGTTAYMWAVWDVNDKSGKTELIWLPPKPKPQKGNKKAAKTKASVPVSMPPIRIKPPVSIRR